MQETERIEQYIKKAYGGVIRAAYGCSLGGSFVGLLAAREKIHMDYGIIGSSDLDQAGKMSAGIQTGLVMKVMYPLLHNGSFKSGFMQRFFAKRMAGRGSYGENMMKMFGIGTGGLPFVQKESVRRQFYSDLVTPLPEHIAAEGTQIHVFYALKMGEKYRDRYERHFANPVIHEMDLQHEELLACYPEKWAERVTGICLGDFSGTVGGKQAKKPVM